MQFKHRYAEAGHIRYTMQHGGGLVAHTLEITSGIPLQESSPGYDSEKVNELEMAAASFAQHHGCHTIDFRGAN